MNALLRFFPRGVAACLAFAGSACGATVTEGHCDAGSGGAASEEPCPANNVFCHVHGGRCWTDEETDLTYADAAARCESLNGSLPGISALRTLFVDCPVVEPGGDCGVTDQCASKDCFGDVCIGCGDGGLNVFHNENVFWSQTANSGAPGERFAAVYRYNRIGSYAETETFSAYCVAEP